MTHEERTAWLAGLKAGDEVCVEEDSWGKPSPYRGLVKRRTPGVQIIVAVGAVECRFRSDGSHFSGTASCWSLEPLTPERREEIQRRSLVQKLQSVNWSTLPTATLRQVRALVEAAGERGEG